MFSVPSYSDMTCQPTGAALSLPFPDQLAQRRAKDQYQKSIRGNSAEQPSLRWVGGRSVDCWDCWAVAVQRGPQGRAKRFLGLFGIKYIFFAFSMHNLVLIWI